MITAHLGIVQLFETAKVTRYGGTAEFVVEGRAAQRPFEHDLQCRGNAPGLAMIDLPGLHEIRHAKIRHAEPDQPGFGARSASNRTLIADLATGTGRGTRIGRDRGGMIMRLDLDHDVHRLALKAEAPGLGIGKEAARDVAADHRRIVGIGTQHRGIGGALVGIADHREQAARLGLAVDVPARVEDLVPAVLAVGLGKHHQLDIAGVAPE